MYRLGARASGVNEYQYLTMVTFLFVNCEAFVFAVGDTKRKNGDQCISSQHFQPISAMMLEAFLSETLYESMYKRNRDNFTLQRLSAEIR